MYVHKYGDMYIKYMQLNIHIGSYFTKCVLSNAWDERNGNNNNNNRVSKLMYNLKIGPITWGRPKSLIFCLFAYYGQNKLHLIKGIKLN